MLLDASGLLCLHHQPERFHHEAVQAYHAAHIRLTHGYVLAEFVALAQARRLPRLPTLEFLADLAANQDIKTIWVDASLHQKAIALL